MLAICPVLDPFQSAVSAITAKKIIVLSLRFKVYNFELK